MADAGIGGVAAGEVQLISELEHLARVDAEDGVGRVAAGLEADDGVGLLAHGNEGDQGAGDFYTLVAQGFDCVFNGRQNNVHIEIAAMSEEIKRKILGRTKWSVP